MPFGEGPRKCLGMLLAKTEMRVSLPHLLPLQTQHFWVGSSPDHSSFNMRELVMQEIQSYCKI